MTGTYRTRGLVVAAMILVITSCGTNADLTAQTWTLVDVGGEPVVAEGVATLTFDAGTLAGNTGCNSFQSSYEVDGSAMTIDPVIAATQMACLPDVMQQETAVFEALGATTEFSISGNKLTLISDSGDELATYTTGS